MIIKTCIKHGELTLKEVVKSKFNANGERTYRCKTCLKEAHRKHYDKHRDRVKEAHRKYIDKDPVKLQQMKNASQRKMKSLNKEKYRKRQLEYERKNPEGKKIRQKRHQRKVVDELRDTYIKAHLTRGTSLTYADIPQSLIEMKRAMLLLKRGIRDIEEKEREEELWRKINEVEKHS